MISRPRVSLKQSLSVKRRKKLAGDSPQLREVFRMAQLRRVMRSTEFFTLAFGSIVGVGWMVVIEEWLTTGGPLGAMLAFLLCGLAMVPVALVYSHLAARMPESASEIAYAGA